MRQLPAVRRVPAVIYKSANTYVTPRLRTTFGEQAFTHAGPTASNLLPVNIRAETSQIKFKTLLKTHYLNLAFPVNCVFSFRDSSRLLFYVL